MSKIEFISASQNVEIHLPDGRVLTGPRGTMVGDFLKKIDEEAGSSLIVGAIVNGELRELTYPVELDSRVQPVTMGDEDGARIYRRSLTFLLETAFEQLCADTTLTIDHSVAAGGYFCQAVGQPCLTTERLVKIEARMRALVAQDLPIVRKRVPLPDTIEYFKQRGYDDKVRLLTHRKKDYLMLYCLDDHRDYHHGYMVPSTGYLQWFALKLVEGGFILRFPRRKTPTKLLPMPEYPKMLVTFREYGAWLDRLGIGSVGALNDAILAERTRELILVSEALHEQHIAEIAAQIAARRKQVRVILIAGPSSSGKTTTSKRLSVQLLARGVSPFPLEMDNYFVPRTHTPRDEDGEYDFESIFALDRELLARDLQKLIAGERVQLPRYNFHTGTREKGEVAHINPGQMIILEGIHGLNPQLIPDFPAENTFRIYISALTQLNLDRHNRVSTTDTRLLRRIVRDARERGYNAQTTINRWESVTRGEKRNIFPYQENADVMFNSALAYELSALKSYAEPLLRQVDHGTHEHIEAKRLLALLEWFLPVSREVVPDNSILREFLGGSILKDFRVWQSD